MLSAGADFGLELAAAVLSFAGAWRLKRSFPRVCNPERGVAKPFCSHTDVHAILGYAFKHTITMSPHAVHHRERLIPQGDRQQGRPARNLSWLASAENKAHRLFPLFQLTAGPCQSFPLPVGIWLLVQQGPANLNQGDTGQGSRLPVFRI